MRPARRRRPPCGARDGRAGRRVACGSRTGSSRRVGPRRRVAPRWQIPVSCTARTTGFGSTGPYAQLKAYEGVVQAKTASFSRGIFAFRDGPISFAVCRPRARVPRHPAVSGILAVVYRARDDPRARTTRRHVARAGNDPVRLLRHLPRATRRACRCCGRRRRSEHGAGRRHGRESICTLHLHERRSLDQLLTAAAAPGARGPSFHRSRSVPRGGALLARAVLRHRRRRPGVGRHALGTHSCADLGRALPQFLAEADLPFELCGTSEEALDHPQIIANGEVVEVDDPVLATVREVGPLATFARESLGDRAVGTRVGASGGVLTSGAPPAAVRCRTHTRGTCCRA